MLGILALATATAGVVLWMKMEEERKEDQIESKRIREIEQSTDSVTIKLPVDTSFTGR
jgi:hypothetical protein